MVGAAAVILIYVAIGVLPILYVHPGSFRATSAPTATPTIIVTIAPQPSGPPQTSTRTVSAAPQTEHPVDQAALAAARNDARIPIGVTAAALVAAAATGFGVQASRRSVRAAEQAVKAADKRQVAEAKAAEERRSREADAAKERQSIDQQAARRRHDEEDVKWVKEQREKRFIDAARQLGSGQGPERLAGVFAMTQLADEWVEQRQRCIDVLCGAYRVSGGEARRKNSSEDRIVKQAIVAEVVAHTRGGDLDGVEGRGGLIMSSTFVAPRSITRCSWSA